MFKMRSWVEVALVGLFLVIPARPGLAGNTPLPMTRVATGLSSPIYVTHLAGDYDRLCIVQQCGRIRILNLQTGTVLGTDFLNITAKVACGGEQGLLGLAFHPDYNGTSNKQFFVNYTDLSGRTVVSRFHVSADPNVADTAEEILLRVSQPFTNHNGGWIDFGPDGYLYIAMGDGGSGGDPDERAQDITDQLLGKILRIDVNGDDFPADSLRNYANPPDNPFVGITGDDEIWAYGVRNPWRCSFDRMTGDFYMGDVGQDAWEEVNFQPAASNGGENYGWDCMEGLHCRVSDIGCVCNSPGLTLPVHEYAHVVGLNSLTGGYVYRGCAIPEYDGLYFFGDYARRQIWSFRMVGGAATELTEYTAMPNIGTINSIASFGQDADGEMYLVDLNGGVYKFTPPIAPPDCNENDLADACDIARGDSLDVNDDGIPDECLPPVPAVSQWGLVVLSLLTLIAGALVMQRRAASQLA